MNTNAPSKRGAAVDVKSVGKRFDSSVVLRDIDLHVEPGEFVSILGPSGCGKTTLLRILAGLESPDQGRVFVGGRDVTTTPAFRRDVNTVFQNYALFPHLSVRENIEFGLRSRTIAIDEMRLKRFLDLVRIGDLASRRISTLSGGQKQRVALARALVNEPSVLLLDEPMSALDAKLRDQVREELRTLHRETGITFILVTHDQEEALSVSDRIVVMNQGTIEQTGSPQSLYESPRTRFVADFIGAANILEISTRSEHSVSCPLGTLIGVNRVSEIVALAIRPERLRVSSGTSPTSHIVKDILFRGDRAEVIIEPGGLRARVDAKDAPAIGTCITLQVDPAHLIPLYA